MKLRMKFDESGAVVRCRSTQKSAMMRCYLAKIRGAHPRYALERDFLDAEGVVLGNRIALTYKLEQSGLYELSEKRLDEHGAVIEKTRYWLLFYGDKAALLPEWAMGNNLAAHYAECIEKEIIEQKLRTQVRLEQK